MPQRREETGEEEGSSLGRVKKGSRNELLYMNMEERAVLCVSDRKTKGCYLHGAHLTLDFELVRGGDDDFFSPCTSPSLLTAFQINRAGD